MPQGPKKAISVVVPEELYEELVKQSERSSRSLSSYIRQVLRAHLEYTARFRRP